MKNISGALGWWTLFIAIVGDFAVPYILATFYKGYSHKSMVMSVLGNPNSPVKIYYNIWLVVLGFLLILSSFTIFAKYNVVSKPLSIAVAVLIVFFAAGAGILAGLFSVNEAKEIKTVASKIHGIGASLGFMALTFVPLLLTILSFKNNEKTTGVVSLISFVLAFVFFVLFIMSDKPEFQNTVIASEGIWQRLSLLFMYFPLGYIAIESLLKLRQS